MKSPATGHGAVDHDELPVRNWRVSRLTRLGRPGSSTDNMAYVRRLLRQKQPAFAAALELAVMLAERELQRRRGEQASLHLNELAGGRRDHVKRVMLIHPARSDP